MCTSKLKALRSIATEKWIYFSQIYLTTEYPSSSKLQTPLTSLSPQGIRDSPEYFFRGVGGRGLKLQDLPQCTKHFVHTSFTTVYKD
jgi:hypothetical protein